MAGLKDIATVGLQELLRVQPNISLYWLADNMPIKLEDRPWWEAYRQHLEQSFSQDEIVIRAVAITRL